MNSPSPQGWSTRLLPHDVFSAAVLPESRRMFISNASGIFELGANDALTPIGIDMPRKFYNVDRMHHDSAGAVYFSSRESNRLYRLPPGGNAFHVVVPCLSDKPGGEDTVRGFAEAGGRLFTGRYSRTRPAILLASNDGETWEKAWEWDARHVHDVRLNPHSGWLYVVVGEGTPDGTAESHSLWRSKDEGRSFQRIFRPQTRRPLFLPINFLEDRLILGTDHSLEPNYIASVVDDGGDVLRPFDMLFRLPATPDNPRVQPFPYFLEWHRETLFLGTRGSGAAVLYATRNLIDWSIVHVSSAATGAGVCFVNCSRAVEGGPLILSGRPGMIVSPSGNADPLGIGVPPSDLPEPPWVKLECAGNASGRNKAWWPRRTKSVGESAKR